MTNFRGSTSKDEKYVLAKQRMMQPVYDFRTGKAINVKSKITWLADLITKESTFNKVEVIDEATK